MSKTVERKDRCRCNGNNPDCKACGGTGEVTVVDTVDD